MKPIGPTRSVFHTQRHSLTCVALAISLSLAMHAPTSLQAEEVKTPPTTTRVFVHPVKLSGKDKLQVDGKNGKLIPLKSESILIWVDLRPEFF